MSQPCVLFSLVAAYPPSLWGHVSSVLWWERPPRLLVVAAEAHLFVADARRETDDPELGFQTHDVELEEARYQLAYSMTIRDALIQARHHDADDQEVNREVVVAAAADEVPKNHVAAAVVVGEVRRVAEAQVGSPYEGRICAHCCLCSAGHESFALGTYLGPDLDPGPDYVAGSEHRPSAVAVVASARAVDHHKGEENSHDRNVLQGRDHSMVVEASDDSGEGRL